MDGLKCELIILGIGYQLRTSTIITFEGGGNENEGTACRKKKEHCTTTRVCLTQRGRRRNWNANPSKPKPTRPFSLGKTANSNAPTMTLSVANWRRERERWGLPVGGDWK